MFLDNGQMVAAIFAGMAVGASSSVILWRAHVAETQRLSASAARLLNAVKPDRLFACILLALLPLAAGAVYGGPLRAIFLAAFFVDGGLLIGVLSTFFIGFMAFGIMDIWMSARKREWSKAILTLAAFLVLLALLSVGYITG